jgi:hypothetical protein
MHGTTGDGEPLVEQSGVSPAGQGSGLTRRQVLARGAAGGAALWVVPTLQVIGATAADAASGPPAPPPAPPSPVPGPTEGLPGHGFAIVTGGSGPFVVQIDSGAVGALSGLGNQDEQFLRAQHGVVEGTDYRQPTPADLAAFGVAGNGFGATWCTPPGGTRQAALFLVLPSGHEVRHAYAFDGSCAAPGGGGPSGDDGAGRRDGAPAEGCGDGDTYTCAHVSGRLVYFLATCDGPATGQT